MLHHSKISPFLTFDDQAEDAARFYTALFPNSRIVGVHRYPPGGPAPAGTVMTVDFELDGTRFTALNAGPAFDFSEAISFVIACDSQQEVDHYWNALTADGGAPSQCGWLTDKFGVSWQVIPQRLMELMTSPDTLCASRVMQAMMKMTKIELAPIEAAAAES